MALHLPSLMLIIGYALFWVELYFIPMKEGHTSPLAWVAWILIAVYLFIKEKRECPDCLAQFFSWWRSLMLWEKLIWAAVAGLIFINLSVAGYVSFFPPHLGQESDFLTYHITVPRQHLIRESFAHIKWSTADLYQLPLDYALAPFWLATDLPNKLPQFIFVLGLLALSGKIAYRLSRGVASACFVMLAVAGSHNIGIQMGLAMLDLTILYLFLAALDSLMSRKFILAAIECAFLFWSKSFMPIQMTLLAIGLAAAYFLCRKIFTFRTLGYGFEDKVQINGVGAEVPLKKIAALFLLFSLFIGGPGVVKALRYAGTPLFPFMPFQFSKGVYAYEDAVIMQSIEEKAQNIRRVRDGYGSGRGMKDFIIHWWLIAVPEKNVNNRYDYPVGLMYLLFVVPFFYFLAGSFKEKHLAVLPVFVVLYWLLWWMGSHQSRFLFIPIALMFLCVGVKKEALTKTLLLLMMAGLLSTSASIARAHKSHFTQSVDELLRPQDKQLIAITKAYAGEGEVKLTFPDVAFAGFAVDVQGDDSDYTLKYDKKL